MKNIRLSLPRGMSSGVLLADGHKPFHDQRAWKLLLRFIRDWHPTYVINLGDDAECYHWSRHDKSPLDSPLGGPEWNADAEVQAVQRSWTELVAASPKSKRIYCLGNHEARVHLHPRQTGDPAAGKGDTFVNKFQLASWWDKWVDYGYAFKLGHLWLTHGHTTVEGAAKKMLKEWGSCVAFGHTHREGQCIQTYKSGHVKGAWTVPCHCRLDPHYTANPTWNHGFGFAQFTQNGWFNLQVLPIVNYRFVFGNKLYQG